MKLQNKNDDLSGAGRALKGCVCAAFGRFGDANCHPVDAL
jgi:hypothetical protein